MGFGVCQTPIYNIIKGETMKDKIVIFMIFILLVLFAILINKLIFCSVINSNIPDWLKYIILK